MANTIQKEIAIKCLETLGIYKPYVRKFKSKAGIPCFFENFGGFYADQEPVLWQKIQEIEAANNYLVYAVTHEIINGDEMWSMLCVPENTTVDDLLMRADADKFYAFAYVWNTTTEDFSEAGDVFIRSFGGGIKRLY